MAILLGSSAVLYLIFVILPYTYPPNSAWQLQYWATQKEEVQHQIQLWNEQKITKYKIGFKSQDY